MANFTKCNVCKMPGTFAEATNTARVPCNVRFFHGNTFTFWRCSSCQSLHCLEDADMNLYYKHYPIKVHTLDYWARKAYANVIHRLRRAGLNHDTSILDYGSGPGIFVQYLKQLGYTKAVNYDAYIPEYSSEQTLKQQYSCIVAQDVIEHVNDPRAFLSDMKHLLAPGGILSIGTPDAGGINLSTPDIFALSLHPPYHRHILSESALIALASELGLAVVKRYDRFYYDTLWPTVNYRFLREYVRRIDNTHDAAFEPARVGVVFRSPVLWFYALFGYFFPPRSEMMIVFKKIN